MTPLAVAILAGYCVAFLAAVAGPPTLRLVVSVAIVATLVAGALLVHRPLLLVSAAAWLCVIPSDWRAARRAWRGWAR